MTGERRKARAIAFKLLYEVDSVGHSADGILKRALAESGLSDENNEFIREEVSGVINNREDIG